MPEFMWVGLAAWIGGIVGASAVLLSRRRTTDEEPSVASPPHPPVPLAGAPQRPFDILEEAMALAGNSPRPHPSPAPPPVAPPTREGAAAEDETGHEASAVEGEDVAKAVAKDKVEGEDGQTTPVSAEAAEDDTPLVLIHREWSAAAVLRQLEANSPQIQSLYLEMGFSLADERQCAEMLQDIRQQIRAEIPQLDAFRQTLNKLTEQARDGSPNTPPVLQEARRQKLQDPLLRSALRVLDDEVALLDVLNRNPVMEALPFIEQIPIYRDGKVSWRTPVELKILRKRPADPGRLLDTLSELHRRVRASELRRPEALREAVLDAIGRVERDLRRPNAYLPTSLRALLARVDDWLFRKGTKDNEQRRQRLEVFLRQLVEVRHCFDNALAMDPAANRRRRLVERLTPYRRSTLELANYYLHASWLQRPLISSWLIHNLLSAELVTVPHPQRRDRQAAGGVLAMICRETADGHYDARETMRRLHQLEERGFYVHSLVFALLRLPIGKRQGVR